MYCLADTCEPLYMAQRSFMPRGQSRHQSAHLLECCAASANAFLGCTWLGLGQGLTSTNAQELARRLPEPEERESKSQEDLLHEVQPSQCLGPGLYNVISNGLHAFRPAAMRAVILLHHKTSINSSLLQIGACCPRVAANLAVPAASLLYSILPAVFQDRGVKECSPVQQRPPAAVLLLYLLLGQSGLILTPQQSCSQTAPVPCSTSAMLRSGHTTLVSTISLQDMAIGIWKYTMCRGPGCTKRRSRGRPWTMICTSGASPRRRCQARWGTRSSSSR